MTAVSEKTSYRQEKHKGMQQKKPFLLLRIKTIGTLNRAVVQQAEWLSAVSIVMHLPPAAAAAAVCVLS